MLRKVLIILTFMGLSANLLAQGGDTTKIEYRGYEFVSVYSSVEGFGVTVLDIYKDGRSIFKLDEDLLIESVSFEDLKGNGDIAAFQDHRSIVRWWRLEPLWLCVDKCAGVWVARRRENGGSLTTLNQATISHDADPVGHPADHVQIVTDQNDGHVQPCLQTFD